MTVSRGLFSLLLLVGLSGLPVVSAQQAQAVVGEERPMSAALYTASPAWSPDGRSITYVDQSTWSIVRQTLNSTAVTTLVTRDGYLVPTDPKWSPDGTKLAYTQTVDAGFTDNAKILDITNNTTVDLSTRVGLEQTRGLDWSPDGTKVVFVGFDGHTWRLYVAGLDGSGLTPISDVGDGSPGSADWSPDGSLIAFNDWGTSPQTLKVVNTDGTNEHVIASDVFEPDFSPDGTKIVASRPTPSIGQWQMEIYSLAGDVLERLAPNQEDQSPSWSPDGNFIAFTRTLSGGSRVWIRSFGPAIPTARPTSVSINNGDRFTDTLSVTLNIVAPPGARKMTVSNDGGFLAGQTVRVATTMRWQLDSTGKNRIPKIVYVRFDTGDAVFTDDIVLDQTDPTIDRASVSSAFRLTAASRADGLRHRTLRLRAHDNRSGVSEIQVNKRKSGKHARTYSYARRTKIPCWITTYVRVRDSAGNWSRWRVARR